MVVGVTVILVALTFLPGSRSGPSLKEFTEMRPTSIRFKASQRRQAAPRERVQGGLLDPKLLPKSLPDALRKLDPRTLWRNPVMFIVEIGAVLVHGAGDPRLVLVRLADRVLALAHRRFRQPRRGRRRRPWQSPGRHAAQAKSTPSPAG